MNILSKNNKFGAFCYFIGIALLMIILTVSAWTDFEAMNVDVHNIHGSGNLPLVCPVFITPDETGIIKIKVENTQDRVSRPYITTVITQSTLSLLDRDRTFLNLQPGETQIITREFTYEDAVFGKMVLVNAKIDYPYPTPDLSGLCGIYVLDISFLTGSQLLIFLSVSGLLLSGLGLFLYIEGHRPLRGKIRLTTISYSVILSWIIVGIILSNIGFSQFGFFAFIIAVIAITVLLFGEKEFSIQD